MRKSQIALGVILMTTILDHGAIASERETNSVVFGLVDAPGSVHGGRSVWPSTPPDGCPFKTSDRFTTLTFTGRRATYTSADTWYPSWASDGKMYSSWTDGSVNGLASSSVGKNATTGYATILGDDPLRLQIVEQGKYPSDPAPYQGRYPTGNLVYNGVWYYGTYCLGPEGWSKRDGITYNWPWLSPFVGFRYSTDFGKTWTQTPCTPDKPLFGESALKGEPVKIGTPHFVDFGQNMELSPDGKAYLVAHGASSGPDGRRYGYNSWITGDEIYLVRVTPSIENMNDVSRYEFYAGDDDKGAPIWSKDFQKIKPIAAWKDNMGCVTMTYNRPLKKFLMCVTDGEMTCGFFNTYILESDKMTGGWKLVTYMKHFGEEAYFVNIPSKFIAPNGMTLWLCYSANFGQGQNGIKLESKPAGSGYGMCLQEVQLSGDSNPVASPDRLAGDDNLARTATVTVSSTAVGYSERGAVDGGVAGYPEAPGKEWVSKGETTTAWIRLTWDEEKSIDRVWLFDRPNMIDQITGGRLEFSDGTIIKTGELPDDAYQGLEVKFPAKKVKWMSFYVDGAILISALFPEK